MKNARGNRADLCLRLLGKDLALAQGKGEVQGAQIQSLDNSLNAMAQVLGGCERIRNTPIPFSYTLLLHRTAYLYCFLLPFGLVGTVGPGMPIVVGLVSYAFFGLEALGEELEEPFGTTANDLPLDALCRTIEISVLEALGEQEIPAPWPVKDFGLT